MCGIAGFIGGTFSIEEKPMHLRRMLSALKHRGPDAMGYYYDSRVALANARLSIVDLAGGNQPMSDGTGRYWLVFNGEIFNYRELSKTLQAQGIQFATSSDTEVLLQALLHWGLIEGTQRLNGQFAFALYDSETGRVSFGRDRWGERPLYLFQRGAFIAFASEIKALAMLPSVDLQLNRSQLLLMSRLWTTLPNESVFNDITQLPPSHVAVFENGTLRLTRYDDAPFQPASIPTNVGDACDAVRDAMRNAVSLCLRSDVEVGLYLSGGLDSTITCALAQELSGNRMRSFSVEFEDNGFDETPFQTEVAKRLGTNHQGVRINHADIRAALPQVVVHAETMLFRTAPVPMYLLSQQVNKAGIKVVSTGEGADEMFYGYDIFKEAWFLNHFDDFADDAQRVEMLAKLYPYLPHFNQRESLALLPFYRSMAARGDVFSPAHLPRLTGGSLASTLFGGGSDADAMNALHDQVLSYVPNADSLSAVDKCALAERFTLMHGYLLSSQGDRMSSAHAVEGRYPFLDPAVAALADHLPEDMKLKGGLEEKWILKQAFSDTLPPSILARPKQPYRAPGSACLRRGEDDWVDAMSSEETISKSNVIDAKAARNIIDQLHRCDAMRVSPKLDTAYIMLLTCLLLEDRFIHHPPHKHDDISALLTVTHRGVH